MAISNSTREQRGACHPSTFLPKVHGKLESLRRQRWMAAYEDGQLLPREQQPSAVEVQQHSAARAKNNRQHVLKAAKIARANTPAPLSIPSAMSSLRLASPQLLLPIAQKLCAC